MADTDFTIANPRIAVQLDDGRELIATARNPDFLRWERTAAQHGWPSGQGALFLWMTFLAWAALRREGQIEQELSWEEFSEQRAVAVRTIEPNALVHPTLPGADPG